MTSNQVSTQNNLPILHVNTSSACPVYHRTPLGISSTSSSIDMRLQAAESSSGFCSCITNFINRILRFLGLSSAQAVPEESGALIAERRVNSITERVMKGIDTLTDHFRSGPIVSDNGQRSGIVVVMSYNGRTAVSFGTATQQKNNLATIWTQMRQLITSQPDVPDNTELSIYTALFKETGNINYTYNALSKSIQFLSSNTSTHVDNEGTESNPNMGLNELASTVGTLNCSTAEKRQIAQFISRL